ncbi:hypothetical protein AAFF27_16610 [Xylophilus sp. GW821-FHT01B05]
MNTTARTAAQLHTPLQHYVALLLAGEAPMKHDDVRLPTILEEIRIATRDPEARTALALFLLAQVNGGLRASIHTEKAVLRAQEDPDAN